MASAAPAAREPDPIDVVSRLLNRVLFLYGTTVMLLRGKTTRRWNRGALWLAVLSATMSLGPRQETSRQLFPWALTSVASRFVFCMGGMAVALAYGRVSHCNY
jgi:hypothetical protein